MSDNGSIGGAHASRYTIHQYLPAPTETQNAMSSSEVWLRDYETAKQLADDTLAMIQVTFADPHPSLG